ncbi:hypothetical protein OF83DRAFT_1089184, partial [Amylostereum chailletii]
MLSIVDINTNVATYSDDVTHLEWILHEVMCELHRHKVVPGVVFWTRFHEVLKPLAMDMHKKGAALGINRYPDFVGAIYKAMKGKDRHLWLQEVNAVDMDLYARKWVEDIGPQWWLEEDKERSNPAPDVPPPASSSSQKIFPPPTSTTSATNPPQKAVPSASASEKKVPTPAPPTNTA